jgi:hypothetical protein
LKRSRGRVRTACVINFEMINCKVSNSNITRHFRATCQVHAVRGRHTGQSSIAMDGAGSLERVPDCGDPALDGPSLAGRGDEKRDHCLRPRTVRPTFLAPGKLWLTKYCPILSEHGDRRVALGSPDNQPIFPALTKLNSFLADHPPPGNPIKSGAYRCKRRIFGPSAPPRHRGATTEPSFRSVL